MSENKRNRRYNNLKEVKKVILTKRENRDESTAVEPPKLLLKPKPKTEITQPTTISIAVREPSGNVSNKTPIVIQSGNGSSSSASGILNARENPDNRIDSKTATSVESSQTKHKQMTSPLPLINDNFQIDQSPMSFLNESNDSFHVVGVIGTQGTGKSTLLNILAGNKQHSQDLFFSENNLFDTNRGSENSSCNPTTKGINMFVTSGRMILLDSLPLICSPFKKDGIVSEFDDLRMVSFMLSVCHIVLVVEEDPFNISLLRLLCFANMMRISVDKDKSGEQLPIQISNSAIHQPQIMFVHNFAKPSMFLPAFRERVDNLYLSCLKNTELRILSTNILQERTQIRRSQPLLNAFTFPKVPKKGSSDSFNGYTKIPWMVKQFRQRVFYSPRIPFPGANPLTEMHWWQMANAVWESQKTNYFLRKFINEKE